MKGMACDYCVDTAEVGIRIRTLRQKKGISIRQMEEYFGITPQALYKWERGIGLPEIQNLIALSRLLGVTVDELLVGNNYPLAA